jgi:hypothetical protein
MRTIKIAFVLGLLTQSLLGIHGTAQAQTTSGSFDVTIVLRTFSEAVTADHRCTHRGQPDGHATLRISCPATVDVQAIASASSSRTGQRQRMNTSFEATGNRLAVVAGKPMHSLEPVELTISW